MTFSDIISGAGDKIIKNYVKYKDYSTEHRENVIKILTEMNVITICKFGNYQITDV